MAGDERWHRLNEIWQSALQLEPGRRADFVRDACSGDEELRAEIESLLACEDNAGSFLEPPGAQQQAGVLDSALTGRTVAHYQILEKLGEGGMSVVYKARDPRLDRFVALKVLPPGLAADPERRRRFVQEAKTASALNHPNIITIHDIASERGRDFIVMEYVAGKTLDQLIGRQGMRLSETLKCAVEIADALAAAHGAGIVHRDVKPSNVMVTGPVSGRPGRVKVLDFGLAKLTETTAPGEDAAASTLKPVTQEGAIVGTVAYMSPEQAQGKPADARSDIFSFGSLLYEMVTGQRAFQRGSPASSIAAILRDEPQPVSQTATGTPPELEKIINRCLRKDPARRFQHMSDLKVALEELEKQSDSGPLAPASPPIRHRRWRAWAVGAFLLAAALGLGAWLGLLRRPAAGPVAKGESIGRAAGTAMSSRVVARRQASRLRVERREAG